MWWYCPLLVPGVVGFHLVVLGLKQENGLNYLVENRKAWKALLLVLVGQNLLNVRLGVGLRSYQS